VQPTSRRSTCYNVSRLAHCSVGIIYCSVSMHIVQLANIAVQLPSTHLPHTEVANITSFTAFQATDDFTSTGNLPSFQQLMSNHEEMFRIALCAQQSTSIYDIVQLANIAVQLPSTHLPHTEVANITSFPAFQATDDFTSTGNLPSFQQLMFNREGRLRMVVCTQQSTPIKIRDTTSCNKK
jgi:hypothetical protein